jgi:hypothetical protein
MIVACGCAGFSTTTPRQPETRITVTKRNFDSVFIVDFIMRKETYPAGAGHA